MWDIFGFRRRAAERKAMDDNWNALCREIAFTSFIATLGRVHDSTVDAFIKTIGDANPDWTERPEWRRAIEQDRRLRALKTP